MTDNSTVKISTFKFAGGPADYPAYARQMRSLMALWEADDVEEGQEVYRCIYVDNVEAESAAQKKASRKAYHVIMMGLSAEVLRTIPEVTVGDGKALWQALQQRYCSSEAHHVQSLVTRLFETDVAAFETVDAYLVALEVILAQLRASGTDATPSDARLVSHVCARLPMSFCGIVAAFVGGDTPVWSKFCERVRQFELSVPKAARPLPMAAAVTAPAQQPARQSRRGGRRVFKGVCHVCQKPGHRKYECPVVKELVQRRGGTSVSTDETVFAAHGTAESPAPSQLAFAVDSAATVHVCVERRAFRPVESVSTVDRCRGRPHS